MTPAASEMFQRGLAALQAGNVADAVQLFNAVLQREPRHAPALNLLGIILTRLGQFAEAETVLRRALQEQPRSDATLHNYGIVLKALGRPAEAANRFTEALAINPNAAETWNTRGTVLCDMQRFDEALADFGKAIELNPGYADAYRNKANALASAGRPTEAVTVFDSALALRPDAAEIWLDRGNVLCALKRYEEGVASYDRALKLDPNSAVAYSNRGAALLDLRRYSDALASCDQAIALVPALAAPHGNRGGALLHFGRYDEALASCDRAISLDSSSAGAWLARGNVLAELRHYDDAFAAYDHALSRNPNVAEAWLGRGKLYSDLKRYTEALAAYDRALAINPGLSFATGARLSSKLFVCDWTDIEADIARALTITREGKQSTDPFVIAAIASSPSDQLKCAQRYIQDQPGFPAVWRGEVYRHDRIRIAYLSADFHEHPIGRLMVGLFERHDRARFEVTGISVGAHPHSPLRHRIENAFDHFVDASNNNDQEIAELIRRHEIDIAVDLMGFTKNNRLGVFARRPAPVQVNYLGFVGTMGADFMDYVIADKIALPFDQQPYFTEKIVHLPDCFVVTDDKMETASAVVSREEAGLPAEGFVFCSFNNSYKLGRTVFERWARILHAVPGSVLWLAEANSEMVANLRREIASAGIDQRQVIFDRSRSTFAPDVWLTQHLARQPLAGLFLDTIPYNAGATAAVALWAGVPLLTVMGETFVGRIAASMLHAVGLPELVTHDLDEYEALAVKLAREPDLLSGIRRKLQGNLRNAPLFNTDRFRAHVESAYTRMVDLCRRGERPRGFTLESE